ncbi:hypothetical protein ACFYYS_26805 [Streptomyces sp. NPDC002120]|uniref:hypothetical protein n=1 Tax=Streptomyces sp. NPDC002120 TaxID=3364631 RepID=UPI00367AAD94
MIAGLALPAVFVLIQRSATASLVVALGMSPVYIPTRMSAGVAVEPAAGDGGC